MMKSTEKKASNVLSRRDFLKTGALSGLAIGSGTLLGSCSRSLHNAQTGDAKNVIFLVSDGMSNGTLTATDHYLRRQHGRASHWLSLYEQKGTVRGLMDMASANSLVTDSSAASSSWGCGQRVNNGRVNMTEEGQPIKTILEIFRDAGKATGLVTTTTITHATPAGFGANVMQRGQQDEIAVQYLERGYDLLLGGGSRFFESDEREDRRHLVEEFQRSGYRTFENRTQLLQYDGIDKLLGLFASGNLPYTVDHMALDSYRQNVPTLAEMSAVALNHLSKHPGGFIVQIEGARIDHAAHANDASALIHDQIAFDDAIAVVLDFVENRDDTLVIITSDHGNANPGLNGTGNVNEKFDRLANFRHSNTYLLSEMDSNTSVRQIRERIEYGSGIQISQDEALAVRESLSGRFESLYRPMNGPAQVLAAIMANYTSFNFVGRSHTADYVELAALGPGSERIRPFTLNTELFDLMVDMAGVRSFAGS